MVSPIAANMCWCPAFAATEKGRVSAQQRVSGRYRLSRTCAVDRNRTVQYLFNWNCLTR